MIRGLRDVQPVLNGANCSTTGRYVRPWPAFLPPCCSAWDVYKSQGADQVEGGVAGIIDVRTNRPFDFKDFTASVNARGLYSDKSKATDPNISGMVANRWKTGIGEVGASWVCRSSSTVTMRNARSIRRPWIRFPVARFDGAGPGGLAADQGDRRRSTANAVLQWRPNADVELYAEGMATRFLLDAGPGALSACPGGARLCRQQEFPAPTSCKP